MENLEIEVPPPVHENAERFGFRRFLFFPSCHSPPGARAQWILLSMGPAGPIKWDFEAALKRLRYGAVAILRFGDSARVTPTEVLPADPLRNACYDDTCTNSNWLAPLLYTAASVDLSHDQFKFLWR